MSTHAEINRNRKRLARLPKLNCKIWMNFMEHTKFPTE